MGYSFIIFTILSGLCFQAGLFALGMACAIVAAGLAFTLAIMYMDGKL